MTEAKPKKPRAPRKSTAKAKQIAKRLPTLIERVSRRLPTLIERVSRRLRGSTSIAALHYAPELQRHASAYAVGVAGLAVGALKVEKRGGKRVMVPA